MKLSLPVSFFGEGQCGTEDVTAKRVGPLAVHKEIRNESRWNVSHINTGRHVGLSLCCQDSAVKLAKALQHLNWDFTLTTEKWVEKFPEKVKEDMREAARIVHSWANPCAVCTPKADPPKEAA